MLEVGAFFTLMLAWLFVYLAQSSGGPKSSYVEDKPMSREEILLRAELKEEIYSRSHCCYGEELKKLKEDLREEYMQRFIDELGYTPMMFDKYLNRFFPKHI